MKRKYEFADVFRKYGAEYKKTHAMNDEQRKVMAAIMACRTARLGGHSEVCNQCGTTNNSYNSCRNRHCPKCQTMTKEQWLDKRRNELLPCGYFHMVFTLPHDLNPLILANQRELLTCLFATARDTLFAFAADPQWKLEGKPGILTVLHTWSQVLLPSRFMKIRYYGFLANICKKKAVLLIHRLIGKYMRHNQLIKETLQEKVLRLTGKDILLCPHCRQGKMMYRGELPALNTS